MWIYFRYSVNKFEQTEEFIFDLIILLNLDDKTIQLDILSGVSIPISTCSEDTAFTLPGDGSVQGFATVVGKEVGQTAVDAVLSHLGVGQYISKLECSIPVTDQQGTWLCCALEIIKLLYHLFLRGEYGNVKVSYV